MSSSRFISALLAASLIVVNACSDTTAPAPIPTRFVPPVASVTLYGTIHRTGRNPERAFVLAMQDGSEVELINSAEMASLNRVEGDEVEVRGDWNGANGFEVSEFTVRRVNGDAVIDGVLTEVRTEELLEPAVLSYALRLRDGSSIPLAGASADMLSHIGARMWVHQGEYGEALAFGIIDE